jgi:hypothetical protein
MRALIPNGPETLSRVNNDGVDERNMKTVALVPELFEPESYLPFTFLVTPLDRSEVKVQFLHACDRVSVLGGRTEGPGPQSADHAGFDAVTEGVQNSKIGNLATGIDGDIDHYIALDAMREYREVRRWARGVGGESDLY